MDAHSDSAPGDLSPESKKAGLQGKFGSNVLAASQTESLARTRRLMQTGFFSLFRMAALINGLALLSVVAFLLLNGWRAINWTFLSQAPLDSMSRGGIFP